MSASVNTVTAAGRSELSGGVCSPTPYLDFCRQDGVELQYSSFVIQRLEEVVV